jgi:hypothetical protein
MAMTVGAALMLNLVPVVGCRVCLTTPDPNCDRTKTNYICDEVCGAPEPQSSAASEDESSVDAGILDGDADG